MDPRERDRIEDLLTGRISVEEFAAATGVDPRVDRWHVPERLRDAMVHRSADEVGWLVWLAHKFELNADWAGIFCDLLDADWHYEHEDLADTLQDIRDPNTVPCLLRAAQKRHEYLDYDGGHCLAVHCIWALHDIGTDAAVEALSVLAASKIAVIRDEAKERIRELAARRPDDPIPGYRSFRDARVRR